MGMTSLPPKRLIFTCIAVHNPWAQHLPSRVLEFVTRIVRLMLAPQRILLSVITLGDRYRRGRHWRTFSGVERWGITERSTVHDPQMPQNVCSNRENFCGAVGYQDVQGKQ